MLISTIGNRYLMALILLFTLRTGVPLDLQRYFTVMQTQGSNIPAMDRAVRSHLIAMLMVLSLRGVDLLKNLLSLMLV